MRSALARRSWRELSRRKARAFFTVLTIAVAVTGLWLFAIPPIIDPAMDDRVAADLMYDVRFNPTRLELSDEQFAELRAIPNVVGVEGRIVTRTQVRYGGLSHEVVLVGVADFAHQEVNVVSVDSGAAPGAGELLTDPQNARLGRFDGEIGEQVRIGSGTYTISGAGGTLRFSEGVDDDAPVLYLTLADMHRLTGIPGITWIDVRFGDPDPGVAREATAAVRAYLVAAGGPRSGFETFMEAREPGTWPGQEDFENVLQLTYVIAALGLFSALFMVYSTMNSVVREQSREIGMLKAIGGRRQVIVRSYLKTAATLGGLGTVGGVFLGAVLGNLLASFASARFSGVDPPFGIPAEIVVLSVVVGVGGTMLAALPAILRATRLPVREALIDYGVTSDFGRRGIDRLLSRPRGMSRMARLGFRNAVRRRGRAATTGLQVGIAVGIAVGFIGLGSSVLEAAQSSLEAERGDLTVYGRPYVADILDRTPGIASYEGQIITAVGVGGETHNIWGIPAETTEYDYELVAGRWFTAEEEQSNALVAVVGPALAADTGVEPGDALPIETATGTHTVEVVGRDAHLPDDGYALFLPITTAEEVTGVRPGIWEITTTESDEAAIDAVAAQLQRQFGAGNVDINYVEIDASQAENRFVVALITVLSLPVVAIGMVGLANTMTMGVIERTREIGILRAIGARARDVRRIVRWEALLLAVVGWVLALPIGYGVGRLLNWLISRSFHMTLPLVMPVWVLPAALVITLVVTMLVVRGSIRRAVRMHPGTAIRYE